MSSRFALLLLACGAVAWACTNDYSSYDFGGNGGKQSASGGAAGSPATGGSGGQAGAIASGGAAGNPTTGGGGAPTGGGGAPTGGGGAPTGGGGAATGGGGAPTGGGGAAGGGGGTGIPSCADEYGSQTGVLGPCPSSATECELQYASKTATCDAICTAGGGECLGAYDNIGTCGHGPPGNCNSQAYFQAVCVCSHGCGGGPPCVSPATCQNGTCN